MRRGWPPRYQIRSSVIPDNKENQTMADVGLVGCSRLKRSVAAPATELYTSPLFRLAAHYCSATCDLWFVLSAKHGLVTPDQVLAPYDATLTGLGPVERLAWAKQVVEQLNRRGLSAA